ncbi:dihydrodipicolinate synthase family protein [Caproiciproducens sp. CPB-2]|uniref:dihydrodipicolinate synthase family protein n=1 Tax=unclassified Caproiciproducens TaxID=2643836 RepID=UPI0023DAB0F5|nr:dihydrodipicolinate synthase family protein [Caproiciproducens sp. CPB-2]MDF1494764.1 dihydrodipicolinate synthase family protein [Caproiciproducens sp. CPB-2]
MKKIKKAYGLTPASMTIWNADQTYNKKGMEKYLTWLLDNGAQSISVCGSTGENIAMNMEEQREIIAHVASFLGGQVPLVCGTGRYDTLNTIKMSKFAQEQGADCVMVILPFYLNPHKKAVLQHFRDLRAALDIDIMIYNNPWFAGYELNHNEVQSLVDDGTIQSIKAAHGDPNRVHELKYYCGDRLSVFYGHDYCAMEGLLAGADGWLSGFPAVLPKQCRALLDACKEKNVDKAIAEQYNMQDYIDYFFNDKVNGVPHWQEICKYTLTAQGLDVGLPRKPLGDLDAENKKKIEKLLANMK